MLTLMLASKRSKNCGSLSILDIVLLVAIFFPWVSFGLNQLDSQPWSILACMLYIALQKKFYISNRIKLISLTVAVSCIIVVVVGWGNGLSLIRSLVGYINILLVILCAYNLKVFKRDIYKALVLINWIWLFSGALQVYINPYLFDFLVSVRTSETRGVTALAPEPTYFAVHIIVTSWIILHEYRHGFNGYSRGWLSFLIISNIFSVFFLAKSAMGVLYLLMTFLLWIGFRSFGGVGRFLFGLMVLVLIGLGFGNITLLLPENSRLLNVFSELTRSPLAFIGVDESINQRLSHVYYSFSGFFDAYGVPRGINAFSDYAKTMVGAYKSVFWVMPGEKIMSWAGQMFFELGVVGLIFYTNLITFFWKRGERLNVNMLAVCVFAIISFAAIPHGYSPLAALIGFYAAAHKKKFRIGRENIS